MSFAGTPLGQGRRLDHNTFLGKPPSNGNRPTSPQRIAPTSYSYGAPALGSRSPPRPKPSSHSSTADHNNDDNALARFARIKQQQQSGSSSSLNPERWSVRDTTVVTASAIHQAALNSEMQSHNPNSAWASGSRPHTNVPRSTSVEYESQSQTTSNRRLNAPPSRLGSRSKPLNKASASMKSIVPDSEGDESQVDQNSRAKSPLLEQVRDLAQFALEKTSFYVRERSREPENMSYDYSAEEREYQRSAGNLSANGSKRINPVQRKNRMSVDNKAYKPSKASEDEDDDDDFSDDGKKRRRKKKKDGPMGGPLTSLPVVGQERRRKKRAKGSKGNVGGAEEDESESEDAQDRSAPERASASRNSAPPSRPQSRHGSVQPTFPDSSANLTGLEDIPEDIEAQQSPDESYSFEEHSSSSVLPSRNGIGGKLGSLVFSFFSLCMTVSSTVFHIIGKLLGLVIDTLILRPCRWIAKINPQSMTTGFRYFIIALTVVSAGWLLREPLQGMTPPWSSSGTKYTAPEIPVENVAELNARLRAIEAALSGLALESEQSRVRTENGERSRVELLGRLGALEGTVKKDLSGRVKEVELAVGEKEEKEKRALGEVKKEMEVLKEVVDILQQRPNSAPSEAPSSDEEARAKLKALEERVGTVESGVKDALDLGKHAAKTGEAPAWWNKVSTGKKGLTIKSSDGQDVSSLIGHLVEDAISVYGKDTIARPDFALHSSGARVIPSLTSNTFEMRPPNLRSQLVGMLTGSGYYIGLPPVNALHHELHNGQCWPFAGPEGQLGVALAAPIYVEHITIDHVAKEVAFDMRSAPRQMEVWGMVEGRDNILKVREWLQEKERVKEEARERGEEVPEEEYPATLPRNPLYIRIAAFTYNIHGPKNIQTFPVLPEIAALGVDFGIVVLRVRNNWGRDEFTCLYRMRVHGQRMGDIPLPYPEEMVHA